MGVPSKNIKIGNALDTDSYNFEITDLDTFEIKHDQHAIDFEITKEKTVYIKFIKFPYTLQKTVELDLISDIDLIYKLFQKLINLNYWFLSKKDIDKQLQILNVLLRKNNKQIILEQYIKFNNEKELINIVLKNKFNSYDDLLNYDFNKYEF